MRTGIEALNVYGGRAFLDVDTLARARGLDGARFQNLLLKQKTVALNFEDAVSFAVNSAKPLIQADNQIELLIVATESGIDFGKPVSAYVHHHLGLSRNCRNFEIKHACYGGTAALQMANAFIRSNAAPGAKALVITTDAARPIPHTYAEPSQGAAAVAMLVSANPVLLELEAGASGYYGYEVMDSCRPTAEIETGDADLSLLTYLDCIENSFLAYRARVGEIDFQDHFPYLAFHAPFGGLAKGAHRTMMRKWKRFPPPAIEEDFMRRLDPSLRFCQRVGNIYSGTVYLALAGILASGAFPTSKRIGLFSYGSGCCSEFFSGLANSSSQEAIRSMQIAESLDRRHSLSMQEYEQLIPLNRALMFGIENAQPDYRAFPGIYNQQFEGRKLLVLDKVSSYHREYRWS
jgi:polyketide biosynthesis 3-hydroxy-3-methylglutaryl-CoA synthase-like enzyme PksG